MLNEKLLTPQQHKAWLEAVNVASKTLGKGRIYWHEKGKRYPFPIPVWYFTKPKIGSPYLIISATGQQFSGDNNKDLAEQLPLFIETLI